MIRFRDNVSGVWRCWERSTQSSIKVITRVVQQVAYTILPKSLTLKRILVTCWTLHATASSQCVATATARPRKCP